MQSKSANSLPPIPGICATVLLFLTLSTAGASAEPIDLGPDIVVDGTTAAYNQRPGGIPYETVQVINGGSLLLLA